MMFTKTQETLKRLETMVSPAMVHGVPRRVKETFDIYDRIRRFGAYAERCKAACKRPIVKTGNSLISDGVTLLDVFPPKTAKSYLAEAKILSSAEIYRRGENHKSILPLPDRAFFDRIFDTVFNDEVDAALLEFFGSEYVPYWSAMEHTVKGIEARRAFCWHLDKGPSRWCKILLYFTDAAKTGGDSILVNRETSEAVSRTGYSFGPVKDRVEDLSDLVAKHGIPFDQISANRKPGQAFLFEPAVLLHRGQVPTRGDRYMMQIELLPSPRPWRESLERLRRSGLKERAEYAWPAHADRLYDILK